MGGAGVRACVRACVSVFAHVYVCVSACACVGGCVHVCGYEICLRLFPSGLVDWRAGRRACVRACVCVGVNFRLFPCVNACKFCKNSHSLAK